MPLGMVLSGFFLKKEGKNCLVQSQTADASRDGASAYAQARYPAPADVLCVCGGGGHYTTCDKSSNTHTHTHTHTGNQSNLVMRDECLGYMV
jgi:hypothetical protein